MRNFDSIFKFYASRNPKIRIRISVPQIHEFWSARIEFQPTVRRRGKPARVKPVLRFTKLLAIRAPKRTSFFWYLNIVPLLCSCNSLWWQMMNTTRTLKTALFDSGKSNGLACFVSTSSFNESGSCFNILVALISGNHTFKFSTNSKQS